MAAVLMMCISARGISLEASQLARRRLPPGYVIDRQAPHERTSAVASKHVLDLDSYLEMAPIPGHTRDAFAAAAEWLASRDGRPELLLDSGCGTGRSTLVLARQHPDCVVIGVDRSLNRLSKVARAEARAAHDSAVVQPVLDNALLVRADLPAFWRLAVAAGWRVRAHRILFPNPYPKPAHLSRRWHGHPSWPLVLRLGGELELRSNWRTYLDEALLATRAVASLAPPAAGGAGADGAGLEVRSAARALAAGGAVVQQYAPAEPFASEFEEKYHLAQLPLYRLALSLGAER